MVAIFTTFVFIRMGWLSHLSRKRPELMASVRGSKLIPELDGESRIHVLHIV